VKRRIRAALAIIVAIAATFVGYAINDTTHTAAETALGPGLVTVTSRTV
jgi:hypothetical protein